MTENQDYPKIFSTRFALLLISRSSVQVNYEKLFTFLSGICRADSLNYQIKIYRRTPCHSF